MLALRIAKCIEQGMELEAILAITMLSEDERVRILSAVTKKTTSKARSAGIGAYIEARKRYLLLPGETEPRLGPGAPRGLVELAQELGIPKADETLEEAYAVYRDELKKANAFDFDDLVAGGMRLLAPSVREGRFRTELFAIGNPNQAIYGFRGSDRRLLERFLNDYLQAGVYRLEHSFRCAQGILGAADAT